MWRNEKMLHDTSSCLQVQTLIKPMEYKSVRVKKILARDYYRGYEFFVVSYGVHPCAYVVLTEGQPYFNAYLYSDVRIECHGGCTFVDWGYPNIVDQSCKVIGWDYAHLKDFTGAYLGIEEYSDREEYKKWTTEEIVEECCRVIDQLYLLEHPELNYR